MPVTPLTVTGSFEILIDDGDLRHRTELHVNVAAGADPGTTQEIEAFTGLSDNISDATFYTKVATILKPLYDVGSSFIGWRVWRYLSGVKTLYNEASTVIAGTDASSSPVYSPSNQLTWFFKDTTFKPLKLTILGNALFGAGPVRYTDLTGLTALLNVKTEFMDTSATHLGNFVRSRGNRQIQFFNSVTAQRNNSAEKRWLRRQS